MSYAIRNTLILFVALAILGGSAWAYLHYVQEAEIETLQSQVNQKRKELLEKQQTASRYEAVLKMYENAQYHYNNYEKALYRDSNEDQVYDFLQEIASGSAYTEFDFTFNDSTSQGQFGVISMEVAGDGYYRNIINFIRKIELSKPLNKLSGLNISPINQLEEYGRVNYNFSLSSYYDRARILERPSLEIADVEVASIYNPFYPLIRDIQPNTENLTNVEQSTLVAVSAERVFLLDQNGILQKIRIGDKVYLGTLRSTNMKQGSATFELNKGGIIEHVTLEVQQ